MVEQRETNRLPRVRMTTPLRRYAEGVAPFPVGNAFSVADRGVGVSFTLGRPCHAIGVTTANPGLCSIAPLGHRARCVECADLWALRNRAITPWVSTRTRCLHRPKP